MADRIPAKTEVPAKFSHMARRQIQKIKIERKRLKEIQQLFEQVYAKTKDAETAIKEQVAICELPEERFIYSRQSYDGIELSEQKWWDLYGAFLQETGMTGVSYIGSVISLSRLLSGHFGQIDRLFAKVAGRRGKKRAAGLYAVFYHKGNYGTLSEMYTSILKQISHLGYHAVGDAYEEYLIDETAAKSEDAFVTKCIIKVEANEFLQK